MKMVMILALTVVIVSPAAVAAEGMTKDLSCDKVIKQVSEQVKTPGVKDQGAAPEDGTGTPKDSTNAK